MPLPDANKKSPRVYTNLQNLDLDNVTFANIQATGNPIAVEEMNEDEMRRLVLVNLARLVTAGEWTGLLEAGGGGDGYTAILTSFNWDGDDDSVRVFSMAPYGTRDIVLNQTCVQNDEIVLFPFIAPYTGTISETIFYVGNSPASSTGAIDVGFYSDSNGLPQNFLGEFVMACTVGGQVTQTTSSSAVETVKGTQYWMSMYADNVGSTPNFANSDQQANGAAIQGGGSTGGYGSSRTPSSIFKASAGGNATITDYTAFSPGTQNPINIGVKW
jgi:hypothetical protein